tara:strand:+ start:2838 stop:3026 length:189 start_codon:yes stop_codon:yes gene_type:complete
LGVAKVVFNGIVGITELAAVAFIKNKNDALIFQFIHFRHVLWLGDRRVQFLYGGNYQFGVIG